MRIQRMPEVHPGTLPTLPHGMETQRTDEHGIARTVEERVGTREGLEERDLTKEPRTSRNRPKPQREGRFREARGYRPDLQYLRVLAVGVVVVFHAWPELLPGGYVGVDVFFVISGYLIIGHLLAEAGETGTVRLGRFWARRIRRLLPAAFTVILVTSLAAWLVLPRELLRTTMEHGIASALYVENWLLASTAVDYLDAEADPSLFQHYWSLSVEEQFYIVWPLLLVGGLLVVRRLTRREHTPWRVYMMTAAIVSGIVVASLTASIIITPLSPEASYFSTPLRAWEFGAGGLAALLHLRWDPARPSQRIRRALWWGGVGMIIVAAFAYNGDTVFPGTAALLPVAGALLATAVGLPTSESARGMLSAGLEKVGDWSYAIYLWHWPVLVFCFALLGDSELDPLLGLALIAGVVVLAALTERWIERPFRFRAMFTQPRRALGILLVGSALVVVPSLGAIGALSAQAADRAAIIEQRIDELGANSSDGGSFSTPAEREIFPGPESRLDDTANQYRCWVGVGEDYEPCGWGDEEAEVRIAIVGDSHASSYLPAIIPLVEEHGWRLDVMSGNGCRLEVEPECDAGADMLEALEGGAYDVIFATSMRSNQADVETTVEEWSDFADRGLEIVPIVDVPFFPEETDRCVAWARDALGAEDCWTPIEEAQAEELDAYGQAALELGFPYIDLTDEFCREERCPAVIGNVIVYRDSPYSHITGTFSRTLTAAMEEQLVPIVTEYAALR